MMPSDNILCIDAGGTFFKYAVYNKNCEQISGLMQTPSRSDESAEAVIDVYRKIITNTEIPFSKIGISTPGPFNYVKGMSFMKHKFQALYGVSLKEKLSEFTEAELIFMSDTNAFAMGEYDEVLKKKHSNILAITIGTGLGMSVIKDSRLLRSESGGVKEVVYNIPYENGIIEDVVSGRGVASLYGEGFSAKQVSELARSGDERAKAVFEKMGTALGKVLRPFIEKYDISCIVVGGQVAKSLDLFLDNIYKETKVEILKSRYENSALRGICNECINNNRG